MDYDNLDFGLRRRVSPVSMRKRGKRRGPDVERDRDVNCHQHHDHADDDDNGDLHLAAITWLIPRARHDTF